MVSRGGNRERVDTLVKQPFSNLAEPLLCSIAEMEEVLDLLSAGEAALAAGTIVAQFARERRWLVRRSLVWMAKFGLIKLSAAAVAQTDSARSA